MKAGIAKFKPTQILKIDKKVVMRRYQAKTPATIARPIPVTTGTAASVPKASTTTSCFVLRSISRAPSVWSKTSELAVWFPEKGGLKLTGLPK
jgi:hypothetical protein